MVSQAQDNRIAFLLGAGISQPAGVPSTDDITCRVLSGQDVMRHTDGTYDVVSTDSTGLTNEFITRRILPFLQLLKTIADQYYGGRPDRTTNFEDLAYLANQIRDSELEEFDNPALLPLLNWLRPGLAALLARGENDTGDWDIQKLADETANYVQDVEWRLLCQHQGEIQGLDYLSVFSDAAQDSNLPGIDIFTTNHDTLLESHFNQQCLSFVEGFGEQDGDVRPWEPHRFDDPGARIRLHKLHGSIDWFELPPDSWLRLIQLRPDADPWHVNAGQNQDLKTAHGRPVMLVGTFDKMLRYTSDWPSELFCRFRLSLKSADRLIVCGYSFRDKGINSQIVEWMNTNLQRRLIIVHPKPDELREGSRGAIFRNWPAWEKQQRLHSLNGCVQDITWDELRG